MTSAAGDDVDQVARAAHLLDLNRPQDAATLLSQWLATHPHDGRALCLAAQAALILGGTLDAERYARAAVATEPMSEWAHRLLAIVFSREHRPDDAMAEAMRAVAVAPHSWRAYQTVADVAPETPEGANAAWQAARRASVLAPTEPSVHTTIASLALKAGDRRTAQAALTEALRLDPNNAMALNEMGRLSLARKDHARAAQHFASALRGDSALSAAAYNIDVALMAAAARLFVIAWLILFIPARAMLSVETDTAREDVGFITLVLIVGALGWQAIVLRPLLARGLRQYLTALPRRNLALSLAVGLTVVGFVALIGMCVTPIPARLPLGGVGAVALIGARIALALSRRALKERQPGSSARA